MGVGLWTSARCVGLVPCCCHDDYQGQVPQYPIDTYTIQYKRVLNRHFDSFSFSNSLVATWNNFRSNLVFVIHSCVAFVILVFNCNISSFSFINFLVLVIVKFWALRKHTKKVKDHNSFYSFFYRNYLYFCYLLCIILYCDSY